MCFFFFRHIGDDGLTGGDGMGEPDVSSDDASVTDGRRSSEDGRSCINDNIVPDVRVTLDPFDQCPVLTDLEALGAERYMLVQLDVFADHRRLTDDDTGSVVDKEAASDRGAGMYIDSGLPVSILCHHTWDQRDLKKVEFTDP